MTVQFRQCGLLPSQFRDHAEVLTEEGGGWSLPTRRPRQRHLPRRLRRRRLERGAACRRGSTSASQPRAAQAVPGAGRRAELLLAQARASSSGTTAGRARWANVKTLRARAPGRRARLGYSSGRSPTSSRVSVPKGTTIRATLPRRPGQALPHRRLQQPPGHEVRRSAWIAGALVAAALSLGFRAAADETISWCGPSAARPLGRARHRDRERSGAARRASW